MNTIKQWRTPRNWTREQRLQKFSAAAPDGCILWTAGKLANGYGSLRWMGKHYLAHRMAWEVAHGPVPASMVICHKCDVPACINPDHLFLGTHADNVADKIRKGRARWGNIVGGKHHSAKLTEEQVREIRAAKPRTRGLAQRLGVSYSAIYRIRRGENWAHVLHEDNSSTE